MCQANICKTGMQWGFDKLIGGGFPAGNVVLITGDEGIGKTIFALEFLYNGATLFGENGLLILLDETGKGILRHANRIGWEFDEKDEKSLVTKGKRGKIYIRSFLSERKSKEFKPKHYGSGKSKISGEVDAYKVVKFLEEFVNQEERKIKRVVIDPLPAMDIHKEEVGKVIAFYQKVRELCRGNSNEALWPVCIIISHFVGRQSYWPIEVFYADSVIKMVKKTLSDGRIIRTLIPSKNRGTSIKMCEYQFEIRNKENFPDYKIIYRDEKGNEVIHPGIWIYNSSFETFRRQNIYQL